ncbi:MAG: SCO family protein [Crocinitomicaceae bacterium]|jgi:protein SCO1/2
MKILYFTLVLFIFVGCNSNNKVRVLPIVGNYDIEYDTIDGKEVADTIYPKIPFFQFKNQEGKVVSSKDLKGKVWIADFFFTKCPTICPTMTAQLKRLSIKTKDLKDQIQFISFSIDPNTDQPNVLRKYITKNGINTSNWVFLTGDENKTHQLGVDYFQVFANRDIESAGGYAHSPAFVLIDKEGYVRGVYVGTETAQVDLLEKDVRKLLKYEYNIEHATTE